MSLIRSHILVCTGTGCSSSNSPKIIERFEEELKAQGIEVTDVPGGAVWKKV